MFSHLAVLHKLSGRVCNLEFYPWDDFVSVLLSLKCTLKLLLSFSDDTYGATVRFFFFFLLFCSSLMEMCKFTFHISLDMTNNSLEHLQGVRYQGQARSTSIPIIRSDEGYWMKGEATMEEVQLDEHRCRIDTLMLLCVRYDVHLWWDCGTCHDGLDLGPHGSMKISKV